MKRMRKDCYQFQIWFRIIYLLPILKQNVLYKFFCKKEDAIWHKEYKLLVESTDKSLYGSEMIPLPTPQCVVFYNGTADTPDEYELRLSSAFSSQDVEPAVEVVVKVININYGHNEHLMQGCGLLSQYAQFVAVTREYANKYDNRKEAMNVAIEYCIEHGILEDILRKHRSQVLGSLLEEFDEKKYARTLREEGYEAGRTDGFTEGAQCGLELGIERGIAKGAEQERYRLLIKLVKDSNLTVQKAAAEAGMSVSEFEEKYLALGVRHY